MQWRGHFSSNGRGATQGYFSSIEGGATLEVEGPCRPSFDIPIDTLVFLIENRFTVPQLAVMVHHS